MLEQKLVEATMVTWTKRLFLILLTFSSLSKTPCEDVNSQSNDALIEKQRVDEKNKFFFDRFEKRFEARTFNYNDLSSFGFLEKLIINGNEIKAEIVVCDPEDPRRQIMIAAPLEQIYWNSQYADQSIHLVCRASPQFKSSLLEALCDSKVNPKVEAQWSIYEYDYSKQKYFRSFHTDDKTISLTIPDGTQKMYISDRFERDAMFISFSMGITFASEDKNQKLFFSFQADGKTFSLPISNSD